MYVPVFTKGSGSGVGGDLLAFNSLFEILGSVEADSVCGEDLFQFSF